MSIQYVGAAKRSDLICHGRTVRRRNELTFTEITATDSDANVVAHVSAMRAQPRDLHSGTVDPA